MSGAASPRRTSEGSSRGRPSRRHGSWSNSASPPESASIAAGGGRGEYKRLSTEDVVKAYRRSTQKQALLVKRAQVCESMLRIVCSALRELKQDGHFITLLRAEGLQKMPKYLAEQVNQRSAS